jgi:TldD protein
LSLIEEAAGEIAPALKKYGADYLEVRFEESRSNSIGYRGRVLETTGKNASMGGNVRALVRGGWGFVSFNSLDDLKERVKQAVAQARLVGHEKSQLAEVTPVQAVSRLQAGHNPESIPLSAKKELMDRYNEIIWSAPSLQTSYRYGDSRASWSGRSEGALRAGARRRNTPVGGGHKRQRGAAV